MSVLTKQPSEARVLYIEFSAKLASGDSLSSITSVTEATSTITIASTAISGTKVQGTYSGGSDKSTYHIVAIVVTTLGETLEADVYLRVIDSASTTMQASYYSLVERVGHFLFGKRTGMTADQRADVLQCIQDGLHDVHNAHSWSFFRPIEPITTTAPYKTGTVTVDSGVVRLSGGTFPSWAAVGVVKLTDSYHQVSTRDSNTQVTLGTTSPSSTTYTTGTVVIASGVVTLTDGTFPSWAASGVLKVGSTYYDVDTRDSDTQVTLTDLTVNEASSAYTLFKSQSFELGRPQYDLPTGFEAIEHDIVFEPGDTECFPAISQASDRSIRSMRQHDPCYDRPRHYGIRTVEFDPTVGSRRRLVLYPTPDKEYFLKARMRLRPTMVDPINEYPIGGEALSQLFVEACLAAAERNFDEGTGEHSRRAAEMLPLAIKADQEMTSPKSLGPDGSEFLSDRPDYTTLSRAHRMGEVTFNGVVQ